MSWLLMIIVGLIVGWISSLIMRERMSLLANILVGIIGSILGFWLFAGVLGIGSAASASTFTLLGILWGVIGAVILIAIVQALTPYTYREEERGRRAGERGVAHEYRERTKIKRRYRDRDEDMDDDEY